MIFKKLKAGALQLTLFIAVVIALLLAAFLILVNSHQRFNIQTDFVIETIDNADKGIQYALQHTIKFEDSTNVDLKDENYKSLKIHRDFWGIFEKITSKASIKNYKFHKVALIGATQPKSDRTALYLEENNKPLVVVGNTRIQGVVYLPQRGVKSGNISGHSYYGEQMIYGNLRTSGRLPNLVSETLSHLENITQDVSAVSQVQFIDLNSEKHFENSFFEPLKFIYNPNEIRLQDIKLTGHIVVQSKTAIIVEATSDLQDVILIAPKIEIKENVVGTFQAIATETITVGKDCKLNYPSALFLNENAVSVPQSQQQGLPNSNFKIEIKEGCFIKGVVVYNGEPDSKNFDPQIILEEDTTIVGEMYCNRNLELKGTVLGTVYTSNFVANQSGSIYQNHIYNGTIMVDELPREYIGLPFDSSQKGVMKWLY